MLKKICFFSLFFPLYLLSFSNVVVAQNQSKSFKPGELWPDDKGVHINAHGGGMLFYKGTYYWFGEHKGDRSNSALVGVTCYSSKDLYNWKNEGVALSVVEDNPSHDITKGCVIERPKVVFNKKTGKFVMWFHLELIRQGYAAARVGLAVSDKITGPYVFVKSYRPNPEIWPYDMPEADRKPSNPEDDKIKSWTPEWLEVVAKGLYTKRDFKSGQMSRDMTIFVDDDQKAYHIYSSEENLTLQIAELSDDYQSHTGKYIRLAPAGHNEAPAIFKKDGKYYMITSGCTGWNPNAARLLTAKSIWGPWEIHPNPWKGEKADISFDSQSTFIFNVQGKKDAFILMADRWRPKAPSDGRYVWVPIKFENNLPVLHWSDEWNLDVFKK